MKPLYCKHCGKKLKNEDALFCRYCGGRISKAEFRQDIHEEEKKAEYLSFEQILEPAENLVGVLESPQESKPTEIKTDIAAEEAYEEVTEEAYEEVTEEAAEEVTEEAYEEVTEEVIEEAAEEAYEEVTEEAYEEVTEEAYEEVTEEVIEEAVEEVIEEAAEEAYEEAAEEAVEEAAEEAYEEVTEEVIEEAAEEAYEEAAEEVIEEAAEEAYEEAAEEVGEKAAFAEAEPAGQENLPSEKQAEKKVRKKKKGKLGKALLIVFASLAVLILAFAAALYLRPDFRQAAYDYHCIIHANMYADENEALSIEYLHRISNTDRHKKQIKSLYYDMGKKAMEEKRFDKAIEYLTLADGFKDSALLLSRCYFPYGESLLEAGDNLGAIEFFEKAKDNPESPTMILKAYYAEAVAQKYGKDYDLAIEYFEKAQSYGDSVEQIKICNYNLGLASADAAEKQESMDGYLEAAAYFEKSGDYADSAERLANCMKAAADIASKEELISQREEKYGSRLSFYNLAMKGYEDYKVTDIYGKKVGNTIQFTVFFENPENCALTIFNSGDKEGSWYRESFQLHGMYQPSMKISAIKAKELKIGMSVRNVDNGRALSVACISYEDLNRLIQD